MSLIKLRSYFKKSDKGAITLEALLSLVLLFVSMYVVWGVSLIIYNQSKLNTATQLSAQAGLITLNRTTYTGPNGGGGLGSALAARWSSEMIFKENMCGTMASLSSDAPGDAACNSQSGIGMSGPPDSNFNFSIGCSNLVSDFPASFTITKCQNVNMRAVRFYTRGSITSPFPFVSGGYLDAGSRIGSKQLNSSSSVYSYTK